MLTQLGSAFAVGVFKHDDQIAFARKQIHRATDATALGIRRAPVRNARGLINFVRTQYHGIDMPAARHFKRCHTIKKRRAWLQRHKLTCGIVYIRIDIFIIGNHFAITQHAIFCMQNHVPSFEIVRNHGWNTHTQIAIGAFTHQARCIPGDTLTRYRRLAVIKPRLVRRATFRATIRFFVHLLGSEYHAFDKNAGQINQLRRNHAGLNDFIDLHNRDARRLAEGRIEVLAAAAKLHIAQCIGAIAAQQCVIQMYRGF